MAKQIKANDNDRRKEILDAAFYCFMHFGYAKTSMDDVAKKANLSRPLIYLKFKNKEELLTGVFAELLGQTVEDSNPIAEMKLPKREKLQKLVDIMVIGPWLKIAGAPMAREFYEICDVMDPKACLKYEKHRLKMITSILGDKSEAEVFDCAIEGLMMDLPTPAVLKKRVSILVDKFTA